MKKFNFDKRSVLGWSVHITPPFKAVKEKQNLALATHGISCMAKVVLHSILFPTLKRGAINQTIFLFFASLLFFNSCSSEPQTTDKIFAHLNIRYLQTDQQVKAEAHFSKGIDIEKAKPIKIENGVTFQGKNMIVKEVPNGETRYSLTQSIDFSNELKFSFPSSKELKNEVKLKMNNLNGLAFQEEFNKSKDVQISWKGNPLLKNESLVFLFNNEKNNFVSFEIEGPTSSSSINIPSEKLKKLPEGEGEIYLVRKQSNITEQSNVTVISETEFYSRVIRVTILP